MTTQVTPLPAVAPPRALRPLPSPGTGPFLKWPGGKTTELPAIAEAVGEVRGRLVDPFVGGGSVLLAAPVAVPAAANDACPELVRLYQDAVARGGAWPLVLAFDDVWRRLDSLRDLYAAVADRWRDPAAALETLAAGRADLAVLLTPHLGEGVVERVGAELATKLARMARVEARAGHALPADDAVDNVEGSVRSSVYMAVRARYNAARRHGDLTDQRVADFYVLRELAYAAMFRFNRSGDFNVPYGGVSYNRKSLRPKVDLALSEPMRARLAATQWHTGDFAPFLDAVAPTEDDVVFVDPPYDSEFSTYDGRAFTWPDQERLEAHLRALPSRVVVVLKATPAVRALYREPHWEVAETAKTYAWTIKERNDRAATHLVLTRGPGRPTTGPAGRGA